MTTRKGPAPTGNRPPRHRTNGYAQFNGLPGYQRNEAPDAEDRADFDVLVAAAERGYRIAVQCTRCGQWLTNPKSVRGFIGPVCAAKAVD